MSFKLAHSNNGQIKQLINDNITSKLFLIFTASHILKQSSDHIENIIENLEKTNDPDDNNVIKILKLFMLSEFKFIDKFNKANVSIKSLTIYVSYMGLHRHIDKDSALLDFVLPVHLNRVRLGKSKTHGNGVFATKVLEEGDIATFYPTHVIITRDNDKNVTFKYKKNINKINYAQYESYIYEVTKTCSIAGFPTICSDPDLIGHMINDGSNSKCRHAYESINKTMSNCQFFNIVDVNSTCYVIAIIVTKRIEIGEELLLPYGWSYWTSLTNNMG
jgi:hypothetical protein